MTNKSGRQIAKPQSGGSPQYAAVGLVTKSILAASVLGCAVLTIAIFTSGHVPGMTNSSGDTVAQQEAKSREDAFATQPALSLSTVRNSEIAQVVKDMGLVSGDQDSLMTRLNSSAARDATQASDRIRLAWITLWDTDAEDGDVVRIDSEGYSRTVMLLKEPVTLAIPVPQNPSINVTGIRDGEGGGITVGLASGASHAIFPIMSIGQTLRLKAKFDD